MERGQSSATNGDEDLWAKLVPTDPSYSDVQIRSGDAVICSQITVSSSEKRGWCEIARNPDHHSAAIRNISSHAIIVDGAVVGEEAVNIKSGSEIISGPDRKGYLGYTFELIPTQEHEQKKIKISFDVEHAKCSICLNVWHDVVTVSPCLHNFCNGCFSEWLRRSSTQSRDKHQCVVCPQCRANVNSVGRNHFLHNIEEAILQAFSSLKRSDEEIALLDTCASIKPNLVLGMQKKKSRKRPLSSSTSSDGSNDMELPCPQCGTDRGGFRCSRTTPHLQCQGCGGMMPCRSNIGVPQHCVGCDRAFCGAYWLAQGVDTGEFNIICSPETFKPISERTISRIPNSAHQNNQHEIDVTEKCIQHSGKTLQAVMSDWIIKFSNREIVSIISGNEDPKKHVSWIILLRPENSMFQQSTVADKSCRDDHGKYTPLQLLPPDASQRENCWYGYLCRTQHHNAEHARKRNHVCRPTRAPAHLR